MPGNYSETEIDTGYTWIDGKKIYKKTIKSTSGLTAGSSVTINHGITNLDIVVNFEGIFVGSTGTFPLPHGAPTTNSFGGNVAMMWLANSTNIRVYSNYTASGTIYITFYYTKSS